VFHPIGLPFWAKRKVRMNRRRTGTVPGGGERDTGFLACGIPGTSIAAPRKTDIGVSYRAPARAGRI